MAKFGRIYPYYLFKDHDPILDAVDTMIKDTKMTYAAIERKSGVTYSTLRAWNKRKTKRPQYSTVAAVVRACGGEIAVSYGNRSFKLGEKK